MSELFHPPVEFDVQTAPSLEQVFVEEACILMRDCGIPREQFTENKIVTTQATERIDMQGNAPDKTVALRLRTLAVMMSASSKGDNPEPSHEYAAILMEHASFADDDNFTEDDALQWQPYVLIALSDSRPKEFHVVNAATGESLDSGDLVTAHLLLGRIREELRNERFEEEAPMSYLAVDYRPLSSGPDHEEFESGAFIDTEICFAECTNPHQSCNHSPYSLN